jgi:hypothetical protein
MRLVGSVRETMGTPVNRKDFDTHTRKSSDIGCNVV